MKTMFWLLVCLSLLSACSRKIPSLEEVREAVVPAPTTIKPDGLPNKHLIKTAFVPQAPEKNWQQPWQDACEEASLLTLYYYSNQQLPTLTTILSDYQKIFSYESENKMGHDINLLQMSVVAQDVFGLKLTAATAEVEAIKRHLSQDLPVVITANGKTLYKENKHFKSGGPWYHSLVILGYDDDKKIFIVHDVGTQFGEYFHYSYQTLLDSIHDLPTSGVKEQIDSGDKKMLVLVK